VHLCFGYAASVKQKPSAYSFLPELEHAAVQQVSIEAAQPQLDLAILKTPAVQEHHSRRPESERYDPGNA